MIGFGKHMVRLSNWTDRNRSAAFAGVRLSSSCFLSILISNSQVYFVAWYLNLLLPTLFTFIAVLIAVPVSRSLCFPPQKLALIDHTTSGNTPAAPSKGEKTSADSATGAPEAQKGEAAEQEANSFVNGIGSLAVGLATYTGE
jgi:hypothetical protein